MKSRLAHIGLKNQTQRAIWAFGNTSVLRRCYVCADEMDADEPQDVVGTPNAIEICALFERLPKKYQIDARQPEQDP